MTKSDLLKLPSENCGEATLIVVVTNANNYILHEDLLLSKSGFLYLDDYTEDLLCKDDYEEYKDFDINAIWEVPTGIGVIAALNLDTSNKKAVWLRQSLCISMQDIADKFNVPVETISIIR